MNIQALTYGKNMINSHAKNYSAAFRANENQEKSFTVKGSETSAKIYTRDIDYQAISQIKAFCNHPVFKDTPIRIMPDVHAGVNSVIGFSAPIKNNKVVPNIVGGDIGCGVLCIKLKEKNIDFSKLDKVIRTYISAKGADRKDKVETSFIKNIDENCRRKYKVSSDKVMSSLGTLGGGNHFIEIDKNDEGFLYLIIHSGSRNFGQETNKYHQNIAKKQNPYKNGDLSYLSGDETKDYLADIKLATKFSQINRRLIADEIIKRMGLHELSSFESIHNYISEDGIIRKGAICADKDKKVIIPLNMRDGAIIGEGKGNSDWNCTAPHGAGRKYKRSDASKFISLNDYKKAMNGIWSSCITQTHIDESPQAYKDAVEIIDNIEDTVSINNLISPVFNYKE